MVTRPRPRTGRRRGGWALLVPLVTGGAGLLFAMSFSAARGQDLRADRDLPQLILAGNDRVARQARTLDVLRQQVDQLNKANAPADRRLGTLADRATRLAASAATTAVRGPALTVSLDDAHRSLDSLPQGFSGDDIVVHQQDVQAVVNSLWASGAEAMMIQDQRVISTSAVRCVGNTLILQGRVYSPPYVIKAVGNVAGMQAGLDRDPGVTIYRQYVDAVGLGYQVSTEPQAQLPAYSGSVDLTHASAVR